MIDFICENCGSRNTYTLMDGTKVCRRCGHREEKNGKEITEPKDS